MLRILACKKPLLAAVNGAAVGLGATMTLPMDFRLAATGARFGFVFGRRGIVPERRVVVVPPPRRRDRARTRLGRDRPHLRE